MYQLIHGDCLEAMKHMADKSVDAIITDPPYLTTDLHFDNDGYSLDWVTEALRIVKDDGYLVLFSTFESQAEVAKLWSIRFSGCWLKPSGGMRKHSAKKPMSQCELYCVFAHPKHKVANLTWNKITYKSNPYQRTQRNSGYKRGGKDQLDRAAPRSWTEDGFVNQNDGFRYYTDVVNAPSKPYMSPEERSEHPTQKPIELISVIARWTTNEGDTIFDPFMGSGTTIVAATQLGRKSIGIEIDEAYFKIAERRVYEASLQPQLFSENGNTAETKPEQTTLFA